MTALAPTTEPVSTDDGTDDLCHTVCTECAHALCGLPDDEEPDREWGLYDDDCLVCNELDVILLGTRPPGKGKTPTPPKPPSA